MSIAGMPGLQGFGSIASQVTGNSDFENVTNFVSQATQQGGIENLAFNQLPGALGLDPTKQQLNAVWNLITGKPVDPSAVAKLVDDSGLLGGVSTQQGVTAFEDISAGNIGPGLQNAAGALGVELPSLGGLNPGNIFGSVFG